MCSCKLFVFVVWETAFFVVKEKKKTRQEWHALRGSSTIVMDVKLKKKKVFQNRRAKTQKRFGCSFGQFKSLLAFSSRVEETHCVL